ncbi:MAG: DUF2330 domain-containing protein [candidate division WOR-3 bacterium]|nr:DUF2330 domain-containing protein [candidate division WOR-3 bacterium]
MFKKIFLLKILLVSLIYADRGLIPFNPGVTIFEPNQRAIIAWNGEEEILLLSTDLHASDSTMVLEVLPLPSEPEVRKGDIETFHKAVNLINQRIHMSRKKNGKRTTGGEVLPPAEITFHEKIGAHDISVVRLKEAEGFVEWVSNYLKSLGFERDIITDGHKKLIEEYINEGFVWFVFDVIKLTEIQHTLEPIHYHFRTQKLFYPLKIMRLGSGNTTIELIIITPRLLSKFTGISVKRIELAHEPITITREDIKTIDEDMHELLKDYPEMKLRIWRIRGEMDSFSEDLIAQ